MKLTLTINTDNAAFGNGDIGYRADEVSRIMQAVAKEVERCCPMESWYMDLRDINGNYVGTVALS